VRGERIVLGLRLAEGIPRAWLEAHLADTPGRLDRVLDRYVAAGVLTRVAGWLPAGVPLWTAVCRVDQAARVDSPRQGSIFRVSGLGGGHGLDEPVSGPGRSCRRSSSNTS
jgi:hypothetical protein